MVLVNYNNPGNRPNLSQFNVFAAKTCSHIYSNSVLKQIYYLIDICCILMHHVE